MPDNDGAAYRCTRSVAKVRKKTKIMCQKCRITPLGRRFCHIFKLILSYLRKKLLFCIEFRKQTSPVRVFKNLL